MITTNPDNDTTIDPTASRKGRASLQEFRDYCKSHGINSHYKFVLSKTRPLHIPSNPISWYAMLSHELFQVKSRKQKREDMVSLEEFRAYCEEQGIDKQPQFLRRKHRPDNIPGSPTTFYKIKWAELFGRRSTKQIQDSMASLEEFRAYCQKHEINTSNAFVAKPREEGIPCNPAVKYGMTWAELFGKRSVKQRHESMLNLGEFQTYCAAHGIDSIRKFNDAKPHHENVPVSPTTWYKLGWMEIFGKKPRKLYRDVTENVHKD